MPRTARSISCVTDIRDKNEIGGEIVKTHKYWAVGALACMVATFIPALEER